MSKKEQIIKDVIRIAEHRRKIKAKLLDYCGEYCLKCGYGKICNDSMTFHHTDPTLKDFEVSSGNTYSWNKNKTEVDKCILFCNRCHTEFHAGLWPITKEMIDKQNKARSEYIDKGLYEYSSYKTDYKPIYERQCKTCYVLFKPKTNKIRYCSNECSSKAACKVERPSKEELTKLVWEKPTSKIAKQFGVSDNAVVKWCKKYKISKPGQGYWSKIRSKTM